MNVLELEVINRPRIFHHFMILSIRIKTGHAPYIFRSCLVLLWTTPVIYRQLRYGRRLPQSGKRAKPFPACSCLSQRTEPKCVIHSVPMTQRILINPSMKITGFFGT